MILLLILVACGTWIIQDGVASLWYYNGKEGWPNQAFRIARLVAGVAVIVIAVKLVGLVG